MNCDEVRELLPAFALDALADDERLAVRDHLAGCTLHEELLELRAAAAGLAALAAEIEPPAQLRARVLAAAAASSAVERRPSIAAFDPARGRRELPAQRALLPYALAAAFAALAIALGVWGSNRGGDPEVQTYIASDPSGAEARVLALRERGLVVLTVTHLPALDGARIYQVWAVRGAIAESLGTFNTGAGGNASLAMDTVLRDGETLAITVEPAGGSPTPTSAPFLATRF